MGTWQCVKNCGACCYLQPSERPDLDEYLSPPELEQYMGMVGEDGWCINYDAIKRECTIYDDRPRFCRVQGDIFGEMFGIEATDLNDFAIDCCLQHIGDMYGEDSQEMQNFTEAVGLDDDIE
jgi:Fe-S-cluster containining protein